MILKGYSERIKFSLKRSTHISIIYVRVTKSDQLHYRKIPKSTIHIAFYSLDKNYSLAIM